MGKSGIGYLLKESSLGGIGGELASAKVCSGSRRRRRRRKRVGRLRALRDGRHRCGGFCFSTGALGALDALRARRLARRSWLVAWCGRSTVTAPCGRSTRRPGILSSISSLGDEANHFPTPSVGDGMLFAPGDDQVIAFAGQVRPPTMRHCSPGNRRL